MAIINNNINYIFEGINTAFVLFLFLYSSRIYKMSADVYKNKPNVYHLLDLRIVEMSIFIFFVYTLIQIFYCLLPSSHHTVYIYDNMAFTGLLYMVYTVIHKIYIRAIEQINKGKS